MNDFYDFATLLIDKEKIEKVIQRKASIILRAFEEKEKSPQRIISLEFHTILVDFALQGLDVSYISENKKLVRYVNSLCKEFDVKIKNYKKKMINSIIFVTEFIWFNIIRDTFLMFEQFLYVILLGGLVPGSIMLADWVIN